MDVKAVTALALAGVGLVVVIISLATDYWFEVASDSNSAHEGLWKTCGTIFGQELQCFDIGTSNLPDWFQGVRAAACLAMITNLAGAVTLALLTFVSSISQKITKLSSIVLLGMAAFWSFIAVVVYAAEVKDNLSWSWGILILAIILEIAAAVLTILASRDD